jgi:hypothetical protein
LDLPGSNSGCISNGDSWQKELKENIGENPMIMEDKQMISAKKSKVTILTPWMEIIGPFAELIEQDGVLLAEIAKNIVVLPIEMKDALMPHMGSKIAILRTDIPGKEYLIQIIPEAKSLASDEIDKIDLPTGNAQKVKASA